MNYSKSLFRNNFISPIILLFILMPIRSIYLKTNIDGWENKIESKFIHFVFLNKRNILSFKGFSNYYLYICFLAISSITTSRAMASCYSSLFVRERSPKFFTAIFAFFYFALWMSVSAFLGTGYKSILDTLFYPKCFSAIDTNFIYVGIFLFFVFVYFGAFFRTTHSTAPIGMTFFYKQLSAYFTLMIIYIKGVVAFLRTKYMGFISSWKFPDILEIPTAVITYIFNHLYIISLNVDHNQNILER